MDISDITDLSFYSCESEQSKKLPADFNKLLNAPILTDELPKHMEVCVQIKNNKTNLIRKRSRTHLEDCNLQFKRLKIQSQEEDIINALERSFEITNLIGDFSKSMSLPITQNVHTDLKCITPETLKRVMEGQFNKTLSSFKIIDCRYSVEYNGGHVNGAVNIYTRQQAMDLLVENGNIKNGRNILIFYCELSKERGPNMSRFVRKEDRQKNRNDYPNLQYPEMYLLEGGFKRFFEEFREFTSKGYTPMEHPDHVNDVPFSSRSAKMGSRRMERKQIVGGFRYKTFNKFSVLDFDSCE